MGSHEEPAARPAPAGVVQLEGLQPLVFPSANRFQFLPRSITGMQMLKRRVERDESAELGRKLFLSPEHSWRR